MKKLGLSLAWAKQIIKFVSPLALFALVLLGVPSLLQANRAGHQADSFTSKIATKRLLLDVVRTNRGLGNRLVAVGGFGHILISDDEGQNWRQASKVPVSRAINSIYFPSSNIGYAVGQDNMILKTEDAGENWRLIHEDPDVSNQESRMRAFSDIPNTCGGQLEQDNCLIPLLSVYFFDDRHGFAVGAFGQALFTKDGGDNWRWNPFPRAKVRDEFEDPANPNDDFVDEKAHLNGIVETLNGNIYVAAEYGTVYLSTNRGKSFRPLLTGYNGSFWGALAVGNSVLAYGMRGSIWRSDNGGRSWAKLDTGGASQSFQDGRRFVKGLVKGTIVLTGLNGVIATSRDKGRSFKYCTRPERKGYAALAEGAGGSLLLFGETGVSKVSLDNPCQ